MRVTWPRPEASRPALSGRQAVVVRELEDPVAAELGELLLQRHAAEKVLGAFLGGQRGVAVAGDLDEVVTSAPRSTGRAAHDEPRREHDVLGLARRILDQVEQQPHGLEAHPLDRLVDRRQRRLGERRLGDVVEPDDGEIVGHGEPERPGDDHRLDRRHVVRGEDRRRPSSALEQVAGGLGRGVGPVAADADQGGVERDACRLQRVAVAPLAEPRGLEVGASGEEADAPVAELDQVLGRLDRALEVVGVHRRERRGAHVVVDGDERRGKWSRRRCWA